MDIDIENLPGVYCIRCSLDDRIYIGHTTKSFKKRWKEHKKELLKNIHHCAALQSAWNEYGSSSFSFHVLHVLFLREECLQYEQSYFNGEGRSFLFNTVKSNGFETYASRSIDRSNVGIRSASTPILRKKETLKVKKDIRNDNLIRPESIEVNVPEIEKYNFLENNKPPIPRRVYEPNKNIIMTQLISATKNSNGSNKAKNKLSSLQEYFRSGLSYDEWMNNAGIKKT
jgi:group I intron endonuclease